MDRDNHIQNCQALDWICDSCGKKGHIAPKCKSKPSRVNAVEGAGQEFESLKLGKLSVKECLKSVTSTKPPELIKICINNVEIEAEIDTGACLGVVSGQDYDKYFKKLPLLPVTDKEFLMADGKQCRTLGKIDITLNKKFPAQALVIRAKSSFKPLVGRTWLDLILPQWRHFFRGGLAIQKVESRTTTTYN